MQTQLPKTSLGKTALQITRLGYGSGHRKPMNDKQRDTILNAVVDAGINFIDTAELYPIMPRKETYGKTEEIIGNWLKERGNRDKIILASKIASKSTGLEWIREGSNNLGFDKKNLNKAVNDSLTRLKTDYIDLYQ